MLHLFRTICTTDWKGRPDHKLLCLGNGTRDVLIELMNKDVAEWQAEEINDDNEMRKDEGLEPITEWKNDERWEMDRSMPAIETDGYPQSLREFAYKYDGDYESIVYHILDGDFHAKEGQNGCRDQRSGLYDSNNGSEKVD